MLTQTDLKISSANSDLETKLKNQMQTADQQLTEKTSALETSVSNNDFQISVVNNKHDSLAADAQWQNLWRNADTGTVEIAACVQFCGRFGCFSIFSNF